MPKKHASINNLAVSDLFTPGALVNIVRSPWFLTPDLKMTDLAGEAKQFVYNAFGAIQIIVPSLFSKWFGQCHLV